MSILFPKVHIDDLEENQYVLDTTQDSIFIIVPNNHGSLRLKTVVSTGLYQKDYEIPLSVCNKERFYDLGHNKPYTIIMKLMRWKRRHSHLFNEKGIRDI